MLNKIKIPELEFIELQELKGILKSGFKLQSELEFVELKELKGILKATSKSGHGLELKEFVIERGTRRNPESHSIRLCK